MDKLRKMLTGKHTGLKAVLGSIIGLPFRQVTVMHDAIQDFESLLLGPESSPAGWACLRVKLQTLRGNMGDNMVAATAAERLVDLMMQIAMREPNHAARFRKPAEAVLTSDLRLAWKVAFSSAIDQLEGKEELLVSGITASLQRLVAEALFNTEDVQAVETELQDAYQPTKPRH